MSRISWDIARYAHWHLLAVEETIDNPYLREFLAPVSPEEREDCARVFGGASLGELSDLFIARPRRDRLTAQYAWAIPTEQVIRQLAVFSPIVDVGCGSGYWAKLLRDVGAEVLAVDASPPLEGKNHWHQRKPPRLPREVTLRHYVDIERADAATYEVPRDHTLLLVWPPYADPMAATVLSRYRGNRVVYVGERGGCTADAAFEAALDTEWTLVAAHEIPQWDGLRDRVYVYTRLRVEET